ncbi:MAG TPA: hypothetical protein DIT03_11510 [Candidatus Accumulibacter sp.]|nr:hypothetical protein [Accumulibacter sp.]HCV14578.1 hypothetical protein [Accumulibacter sp.]
MGDATLDKSLLCMIVARSLRSGRDGTTTLAVRRFAIPSPGRYRLEATGCEPAPTAGNSRLVLARPGMPDWLLHRSPTPSAVQLSPLRAVAMLEQHAHAGRKDQRATWRRTLAREMEPCYDPGHPDDQEHT